MRGIFYLPSVTVVMEITGAESSDPAPIRRAGTFALISARSDVAGFKSCCGLLRTIPKRYQASSTAKQLRWKDFCKELWSGELS